MTAPTNRKWLTDGPVSYIEQKPNEGVATIVMNGVFVISDVRSDLDGERTTITLLPS